MLRMKSQKDSPPRWVTDQPKNFEFLLAETLASERQFHKKAIDASIKHMYGERNAFNVAEIRTIKDGPGSYLC